MPTEILVAEASYCIARLNLMDVSSFKADFHTQLKSPNTKAEDRADHYNKAVHTTLDKHACPK